jgi:hypothetical protein
VLVVISGIYFAITLYRASRKLFWFDEIFTLYLSRLPDFRSLWNALLDAVDFNPPLIYFLAHSSERLFGANQFSIRLPAIIAFWIFGLCLFRFVVLRSSVWGALVAAVFPMTTMAYWYAYEARPHAIVLGCCGIALICWQAAADRSRGRIGWLLGLAFSLALALLSHSYAALIFIPLACGELWRTFVRRSFDWPVWAAIVLPSFAIVVSLPLLHAAKSYLLVPGFNLPNAKMLLNSYSSILEPAAAVLIGSLALLLLASILAPSAERDRERAPRDYEIVALVTFLLIPVIAIVLAKLAGAPLLPRYTISLVAGVACLLGFAAGRRSTVSAGILLMLFAQLGISALIYRSGVSLPEPTVQYPISTVLPFFQERYRWIAASGEDRLPIVLLNYHDFMPTLFYAPPALLSRLVYVMWANPDINGENYGRLHNCCNLPFLPPVQPATFLASHQQFLALGMNNDAHWLTTFVSKGATVTVKYATTQDFLMLVSFNQSQSANIWSTPTR